MGRVHHSLLSLVLSLALVFTVTQAYSQSFRMEDGSTVTFENPQQIRMDQKDIEQIKQAANSFKNNRGPSSESMRSEALDVQNYRRQLETEVNVERTRRETVREYDRLDREVAKTQRLREGRDVILYREGYGNTTYRGGRGGAAK